MLINKTQNKRVTNRIKILNSDISKAIGLMFHKKPKNTAYIFPFKQNVKDSIHNFFVFFPINLIFLDKDKKVIYTKRLNPFEIHYPKKKFKYMIELTEDYNIKPNDVLDWKQNI